MRADRSARRAVLPAALALVALAGCSATAPDAGDDDALSGTVVVQAAASLTEVFDALAEQFEAEHPGVDVVLNYGGSSALAEQIVSGVPADVFAAANETTMQTVTDAGLSVDPVIFTTNTLELAVPAGNPGGVEGLADLADPALAIVLCAPEVPCGSASQKLLDGAGVTASVDSFEQDVKAALTKVALGEADASLVYRTDVAAAGDEVEGIEVPEAADVVNRYPIALLADAPNPDAARAFVDFVLSEAGQRALADAGFTAP